ncbi:MAG: element excision factor XisI family protein [Bacteroidota bacterium]
MERVEQYRTIIKAIIQRPASSRTLNQPSLQKQLLVDRSENNFLLFNVGWHKDNYVHDLLFHIELSNDGNIWILENNTDYPLDNKLLEAGVEQEDLHIAWVQKTFEEAADVSKIDYKNAVKDLVNRMASSTTLNAPNLKKQVIIDENACNFALFSSGWHQERYVYDLLLRIELKEQQIWVYENNTNYPLIEVLSKSGVATKAIILVWNQVANSSNRSTLMAA